MVAHGSPMPIAFHHVDASIEAWLTNALGEVWPTLPAWALPMAEKVRESPPESGSSQSQNAMASARGPSTAPAEITSERDSLPHLAFAGLGASGGNHSDGLQRIRDLRAFGHWVVAVANPDTPDTVVLELLEAGADDLLVTPISAPQWRRQLTATLLRRAKAHREHRNANLALGELTSRFEALSEATGEGICIHENGTTVWTNSLFNSMFGYDVSESIGIHLDAIHHKPTREELDRIFERPPPPGAHWEYVGRRKDGTLFPMQVRVVEFHGGDRRLRLGIVRDVTKDYEAELEARSKATALEIALNAADMGTWDWHLAQGTISWKDSPRNVRPMGLAGDRAYDFVLREVHPDDRPLVEARMREAIASGAMYRAEFRVMTPAGYRWMESRGRGLQDRTGHTERMTGVVWDITERMTVSAQAVMADRLASVGTLAAGVAHEINNPLMYALNNLELVDRCLARLRQTALGPAPSLQDVLPEVLPHITDALTAATDGLGRVRRIVRGMKLLSRNEHDRKELVRVNSAVQVSILIAESTLARRAKLEQSLAEGLPPILGQEARLAQVVLNLLINAAHAIGEGTPDANWIRVETGQTSQRDVFITVSDTGVGIAQDNLRRIFDPFFTTKTVGEGSGLGLAISHAIVKEMGGRIDVETVQGHGTTFRVTLPAAPATNE